jgi:hypothetical protein
LGFLTVTLYVILVNITINHMFPGMGKDRFMLIQSSIQPKLTSMGGQSFRPVQQVTKRAITKEELGQLVSALYVEWDSRLEDEEEEDEEEPSCP